MSQSNTAARGRNEAARLATTSVAIDLKGLVLLGTFGSKGSPGALLRLPNGSVQRIAPGDVVAGRRVAAISDGEVVFTASGRNRSLFQPGEHTPAAQSNRGGSR
ncbi:amidophosphoribosyltransferase [Alisedimentitalea sp. MJ-SS2]|uniref:amidophosphoribosyltransferase n=1 Tax=Aliisedimentitalea sp. MJ-SS2 TaxID=3049795 RepID=UPI002906325D|nr:amidophosphoribosyltransferase [Alisedimentitalea sp. MJ-SS2]MDU8926668.1 amidophosphoribosyltransferase [Alisedimentitalea sp. MJ-SS2]